MFAGISESALLRLIGNSAPRRHAKGYALFERGDKADRFYAVMDGLVKLCRRAPDGQEVVLGIFARGESFAEAAMFMGGEFPASAELACESRLLSFRRESILSLMREDPDVCMAMLASTSHHLKLLVEQIEQVKGKPGVKRVGDFILKLCPACEGSAAVGLPYEKALIAARLGMKPESFSRALARLRRIGVRTERGRVMVSDIAALSDFVADEDAARGRGKP